MNSKEDQTSVQKKIIEKYKELVKQDNNEDEVYKWELVKEFQSRWDIDAEDFPAMIKSINFSNLMFHHSKKFMDISDNYSEDIRGMFKDLFNENKDLRERILSFQKRANELFAEYEPELKAQQDERAISTYLTFRYPEKYTFYKSSFYNKYTKLLGLQSHKTNEKFIHYLSLIDSFIEDYITKDKELLSISKSYLSSNCYDDSNYKILAQNILFRVLDQSDFIEKSIDSNYWIFQGNPKAFDFEKGLKDDLIDNWTVTTHKGKIKNGDKVIIWITGKNSGCYALAEVTHDPMVIEESKDDHLWNKKSKESLKAGIKITHNLIEKPILEKNLIDLKEFSNLKVGNQGTNFTLKETEYLKFLELANSTGEKKYWMYAPGEGAKKWDQFYDEGYMGLGWIDLGDLEQYETKQDIADKLMELDGTGKKKYNDASANWDFKYTISIGDIIIAKKGTSDYLGYGVVESDYYYDEDRDTYKKCRKVSWKKKGVWKEPDEGPIVQKTLTDITKYPKYVEKLIKLIGIEEGDIPTKMELPLNTIIYGPPGTGKTYRLKNEFFEKFTDEQSTQTKEAFCENLIQDTSWWQIISIVMLDLKKAKVQEIFDHPLLQAKIRISENKTPKNTIWSWLQRHTKDDCPNVNFKKRDNPQFFEKDTQSTWTIDEEIAKAETPDFYEVLKEYQNFKPKTESKKRYVFTTFHQSFSYEDFIEGIKPKLMKSEENLESQDISYHIENGIFKNIVNKAINDPNKDYAIFIDEINRGNIANIFGELITLIEEDKRKECKNHISAILPYSKTEFWVPKNLYIIGTMNTADRSVEALDNALRRRFSFLEMNPEPSKLSQEEFACEGVNLEKLLSAINNRIEKLLDKDYCIGHSYFMNFNDRKNPLEDLKMIFSNRILPLLQEYFYGDWGKIMLVLGKGFIEKRVESVTFLATEDYDDFEDYDEKPVFNLVSSDTWTLETFKKIYE